MKKLILLLAFLVSFLGHSQANFDEGIQLTNTTDNLALKVNVQNSDGIVNTISKTSLIEVLEVANAAALPSPGTAGKIYVTIDNQLQYRWTGSIYNPYFESKAPASDSPNYIQNQSSVEQTARIRINGSGNFGNTLSGMDNIILNSSSGRGGLIRVKTSLTTPTSPDAFIFANSFNSYVSQNLVHDGANIKYDKDGPGSAINFINGAIQFSRAASGTAGTTAPLSNSLLLANDGAATFFNTLKISALAGTGFRDIGVSGSGIIILNPIQIKSYVAILNQSALVAPSASIISNTLSGTPLWAYISPGQYSLTLTGAFPLDKTYISGIVGDGTAAGDATYKCFRFSNDVILLNTTFNAAYTNGQLNKASFKIDVYN